MHITSTFPSLSYVLRFRGKLAELPPELLLFAAALCGLNLHLFGVPVQPLHAHPEAFAAGEWWRAFTHPFVHVSVYHLAIDGIAFALLYSMLSTMAFGERLLVFTASAGGSLLAAQWLSPSYASVGLCGLSGAAHGLLAAVGIENLRADGPGAMVCGWLPLALVAAKGTYEAVSGDVLFASAHPASIGVPIAACHFGGVVGAALCGLLPRTRQSTTPTQPMRP